VFDSFFFFDAALAAAPAATDIGPTGIINSPLV
jgi:hypothetical protein